MGAGSYSTFQGREADQWLTVMREGGTEFMSSYPMLRTLLVLSWVCPQAIPGVECFWSLFR